MSKTSQDISTKFKVGDIIMRIIEEDDPFRVRETGKVGTKLEITRINHQKYSYIYTLKGGSTGRGTRYHDELEHSCILVTKAVELLYG